jgi:hypothetical protein
MSNPKTIKIALMAVCGVASVALLAYWNVARNQRSALPQTETRAAVDGSGPTSRKSSLSASTANPANPQVQNVSMLQESPTNESQMPYEPPEQERRSKRAYAKADFQNFQTAMTDYKLDGVVQTADGITLPPPKDDEDARIGSIESPPITLEHASNMVVPIWRSDEVENGNLKIEVAVGTDDGQWSHWYPIDFNSDPVSPTYPDGSPNPNYGARPGTPVGFGFELYPYVKFRATLAATGAESPLLRAMDIYHTDSTDGDGYAASGPPPIHRQIIDTASEAQ